MSFAILFLAAAAQPAERRMPPQATVRILTAAEVTEAQWKLAKRRTERRIRDELGRVVRLRTIDFE